MGKQRMTVTTCDNPDCEKSTTEAEMPEGWQVVRVGTQGEDGYVKLTVCSLDCLAAWATAPDVPDEKAS